MSSFFDSKKNQRFAVIVVLGSIFLIILGVLIFPRIMLALATRLSFPSNLSSSERRGYLERRHQALVMKDPGPGFSYVYQDIGEIRLALKDDLGALKAFTKANQENPKGPGPLRGIALASLYLGDYKKAEKYFLKTMQVAIHHPEYWMELGELYTTNLKDLNKAERFYERALKSNEKDLNVLQAYANFLMNFKKDYAKSLSLWQQIQKETPEHASDYNKVIEELKKKVKQK